MQFIIIDADIPNWLGYYLLALLIGPALFPITTGVLCGRFMGWISPLFGFASGLGSMAAGYILGFFYAWDITDYRFCPFLRGSHSAVSSVAMSVHDLNGASAPAVTAGVLSPNPI